MGQNKFIEFLMSMSKPLKAIVPSPISEYGSFLWWKERLFAVPSPPFVKRLVLLRNGIPDAVWIETGTWLADTTVFLAGHSKMVRSLEPEPLLVQKARKRCQNLKNVEIIEGTSEAVFPTLIPTLKGEVNFWLDGHYSEGGTYKGKTETPILKELSCIQKSRKNFSKLVVLIDDLRCFNPAKYPDFPSLDYLVNWSKKNKLNWTIEHDIFVAKSF